MALARKEISDFFDDLAEDTVINQLFSRAFMLKFLMKIVIITKVLSV
jgi:hypothetical protein